MNDLQSCWPISFIALCLSAVSGCYDAHEHGSVNTADANGKRSPRRREVTFNKDVAAIVHRHCTECHRDGQAAPFPLITYADVSVRAQQIAEVTRSRYMPPWLPDDGFGDFKHGRQLEPEEQEVIQTWVAAGAPEGDRGSCPTPPRFRDDWQLGAPDLIVAMPAAYQLPADGTDIFRTFVLPVSLERPHYVRAVEFRPGNAAVVHHAGILVDRDHSTREFDRRDADLGYDGMASGTARSPDGHFLGWTPGKRAILSGDDIAWRLDPDTDLVLQVHLLPSGKPESVQCKIGLYFSETPPKRTPVVLRLGPRTIDIPAGDSGYVTQDTFTLPSDALVLGIYPHAHYLCSQMESFAVLPDGSQEWLFRISQWDFNWQDEYHYQKPMRLPKGSRIHMKYVFDNSSSNVQNPHNPPQRVVFGPQSSDSMGDLWIQLLAVSQSDSVELKAAVHQKIDRQDISALELALERDPDDDLNRMQLADTLLSISAYDRALYQLGQMKGNYVDSVEQHTRMGDAYLGLSRYAEATRHFRRALVLNPDLPQVSGNLGAALLAVGEYTEAIRQLRESLKLRPNYAFAHCNLANALMATGKINSAIQHYRSALKSNPDFALAHYNLAQTLAQQQRFDEAEHHLRRVLETRPGHPTALNQLAGTLLAQGKDDEAIEAYYDALAKSPNAPQVHNQLAVALSRQGKHAEALYHIREALRIRPDYQPARANLSRIRQRMQQRTPPPGR